MRKLALALALLCLPGLALAQSDNRKVAFFFVGGDNVNSVSQTGQGITKNTSLSTQFALECLDRMGVPYTIFCLDDSAGGWSRTMGATRPAGTADSTWFRQNGYMGAIVCVERFGAPGTVTDGSNDPFDKFTSGNLVGSILASPLGGRWGIPTVVFCGAARGYSAGGYWNGIADSTIYTLTGDSMNIATFADNGDSIGLYYTYGYRRHRSETDSVTDIIKGINPTILRAWRFKTSTYYYPGASGFRGINIILGLDKLFSVAGYKPREKLHLHVTDDHIFPVNPHSGMANTDSSWVYPDRNRWRYVGGVPSNTVWNGAGEYSTVPTATRTAVLAASQTKWVMNPHEHDLYALTADNFDYSAAGDDSATFRARLNWALSSMKDTVGIKPARGYDAYWVAPLTRTSMWHVNTLINAGYRVIRAPGTGGASSDSVGEGTYRTQLNLGKTTSTSPLYFHRPVVWTDPVSGIPVWLQGCTAHLANSDTLWTQVGYNGSDNFYGKTSRNLDYIATALIHNVDYFYHSQGNTVGPSYIMNHMWRRLTYVLNRCQTVVAFDSQFQPKIPRRHNTAWANDGSVTKARY